MFDPRLHQCAKSDALLNHSITMTGPKANFYADQDKYNDCFTEKVAEYLVNLRSAPQNVSPSDVVIDGVQEHDGTTFVQFTIPPQQEGGQPYTDITHFTL